MKLKKFLCSGILVTALLFNAVFPVSAAEIGIRSVWLADEKLKSSEEELSVESTTEDEIIDASVASPRDESNISSSISYKVEKKGITAKRLVNPNGDVTVETESQENEIDVDEENSNKEQKMADSSSPYHWFRYANGMRGCRDDSGIIIKDGYAISDSGNLCYLDENGELSITENQAQASAFPKKGLQGNYILTVPGVSGNHLLMNLYMNDAFSPEPTGLSYNVGVNTYFFNPLLYNSLRETISQAQQRNIKVSIVLLLRGNDALTQMGAMYAGMNCNNASQFYAFNPDSEVVKAFFGFSAMYLSSGGYHVDYWILGNEVNMPNTYNYTGTLDAKQNAQIYARTFASCNEYIRMHDQSSNICISLDNHWTDNLNGYGIAGRDFLNCFFLAMRDNYPDIQWNIAYHLYAPVLLKTSSIWVNRELNTNETVTKFITPANLSVLTDYVKNRISPNCRIILSEQGYDSHEGEHIQAQGLAACFEAAQNDPMVDAVIFRTLMDEGTEGVLDLALVDKNGHEREAYAVYQALETPTWDNIKTQYIY